VGLDNTIGAERPVLTRNGVRVDDSFAEAFGMAATGVIITAPTARWARIAADTMTLTATSVIGFGCEAGFDTEIPPDRTPDGRPGARALIFGFSPDGLQEQITKLVGQCVLTSPGSACYAGVEGGAQLKMGSLMRYFGDGFQASKLVNGRRYWRIPVMDGEFVCEESTGSTTAAVGGGNLLIMGPTHAETILPFPGGIVRSGSKVGSRYKSMHASTNDAFCPTLRGRVNTALDPDIGAVLEIVIDGLSSDAVAASMRAGLKALLDRGPAGGVLRIGAGNYGGKLGQFHYHLKDLLP
jgi:formylmethanofuran--tetrahydromethanopterin N-formyltransferase